MTNKGIALGLVLGLAACGGKKTGGEESASPNDGGTVKVQVDDSDTTRESGLLRLAHYSTGDGSVGLVLDQSGDVPKLQIDGSKDIVQLTAREAGSGSTWMKDPQGKIRLEIDRYGGVLFITEKRPVRVYRDAEARSLAAATITGQAPAEEEHPSEVARARLFELSVLARNDKFTNSDSGNLDKVRAAFEAATPEMFVHVARDVERDVFRPAPRKIGMTDYAGSNGNWPAGESFNAKGKGLRGHGGVALGEHDDDTRGNWIRIHRPEGYPGALAENTPGIVWEVDSSTIVFLTLDGGRYHLEWDDVAIGLPPQGKWPAAVQHDLLTDTDIEYLVKAGSLPKAREDGLKQLQDEFHACTVAGWKTFETELKKAILKDKLEGAAAWAKAELMHEERTESVGKQCTKHVDAFDAAIVAVIDERVTQRTALLGKAKARAEAGTRTVATR